MEHSNHPAPVDFTIWKDFANDLYEQVFWGSDWWVFPYPR